MMTVESQLLHPGADRRVESAVSLGSHGYRKMDCAEEKGTDFALLADRGAEPAQFAGRIESRAIPFHSIEPASRGVQSVGYRAPIESAWCGSSDAKFDH